MNTRQGEEWVGKDKKDGFLELYKHFRWVFGRGLELQKMLWTI
jgi:hypothetical protein